MMRRKVLPLSFAALILPLSSLCCSSSDSTFPLLQASDSDPRADAITCTALRNQTNFPGNATCLATGLTCPLLLTNLCDGAVPMAVCNAAYYWTLTCQIPDSGTDAAGQFDGSDSGSNSSVSDGASPHDASASDTDAP